MRYPRPPDPQALEVTPFRQRRQKQLYYVKGCLVGCEATLERIPLVGRLCTGQQPWHRDRRQSAVTRTSMSSEATPSAASERRAVGIAGTDRVLLALRLRANPSVHASNCASFLSPSSSSNDVMPIRVPRWYPLMPPIDSKQVRFQCHLRLLFQGSRHSTRNSLLAYLD
jgi:hypothetical protein